MMPAGELRAALEGLDDDSMVAIAITVGRCDEMVFEIGLDSNAVSWPNKEREGVIPHLYHMVSD